MNQKSENSIKPEVTQTQQLLPTKNTQARTQFAHLLLELTLTFFVSAEAKPVLNHDINHFSIVMSQENWFSPNSEDAPVRSYVTETLQIPVCTEQHRFVASCSLPEPSEYPPADHDLSPLHADAIPVQLWKTTKRSAFWQSDFLQLLN